jgi:hypothetical protein
MISVERVELEEVPWSELDKAEDRVIFQTRPWLNFVVATQAAEPVVAVIKDNGTTVGYFTGAVVRKLGVKILGSPFKGWTTGYMGFNLAAGAPRAPYLEAVADFAFRDLGCFHVELSDRFIRESDYASSSFVVRHKSNREIDLTQSEDRLFVNMTSACRRCVRKAEKNGLIIEEANDVSFAEDYYAQLQDVFAKQGLVPTYSRLRVVELIRNLHSTGNLLLLRVRDPKGRCIASGIFPAFNATMYFWGGASWRQYQILRPNEALMWYAMRYWKAKGIRTFDMCGPADYKKKYGGYEISIPYLFKPRYSFLLSMRDMAERTFETGLAMRGKLRGRHTRPALLPATIASARAISDC